MHKGYTLDGTPVHHTIIQVIDLSTHERKLENQEETHIDSKRIGEDTILSLGSSEGFVKLHSYPLHNNIPNMLTARSQLFNSEKKCFYL